jgi:hypothetical protein
MPKELGGLGISDLRRAGVALRVRWVWRDRTSRHQLATTEKVVLALFQAATVVTLGNGESTFFWTEKWIGGSSFATLAPNVFAAMRARRRMDTVAEALPGSACVRHIAVAPPMQLLYEISLICDLLDDVLLS